MLSIYKHEAQVAYKCSNNTSSCVIANLFPVAQVIALRVSSARYCIAISAISRYCG